MTDAQKYCMADESLTRLRVQALADEMSLCATYERYYELGKRHYWLMAAIYHGSPSLFDWATSVLNEANEKAEERLS